MSNPVVQSSPTDLLTRPINHNLFDSGTFSSPFSLPLSSSLSTSPPSLLDLTDLVRDFWLAFPCPPPWRPRLLAEVNASSRLEPGVGRRVQAFLAGKCHLQHVFSASDLHPAAGLDLLTSGGDKDEGFFDDYSRGGGRNGNGILDSDEATSAHAKDQSWCDSGCQLGLACAVILAMLVALVVTVVFITRQRKISKMAATRPSSQRLHMSTSASDAANCAEFSNLEVQTDDETQNPLRFWGLPHPPQSVSLPSTYATHHTKWTYPNCSTFHPLGRMNSTTEYYPYAYSAVYETIDGDEDNDDDEGLNNGEEPYENCGSSKSSGYRKYAVPFQPTCGCCLYNQLPLNSDGFGVGDSLSLHELERNQQVEQGRQESLLKHSARLPDSAADIQSRQTEVETQFNGNIGDKLCTADPGDLRSAYPNLGDSPTDQNYTGDVRRDNFSYSSCVSTCSVSSRFFSGKSPSTLSGYVNNTYPSSAPWLCDVDPGNPIGHQGVTSPSAGDRPNCAACACDGGVPGDKHTHSSWDSGKCGQLAISSNSAFSSPRNITHGKTHINSGDENKTTNNSRSGFLSQIPGRCKLQISHHTKENTSNSEGFYHSDTPNKSTSSHPHSSPGIQYCSYTDHNIHTHQYPVFNQQQQQPHHRYNNHLNDHHDAVTSFISPPVADTASELPKHHQPLAFMSTSPPDTKQPCVGQNRNNYDLAMSERSSTLREPEKSHVGQALNNSSVKRLCQSSSTEMSDVSHIKTDLHEPVRKPALALHSQYFDKTSPT
ncbi:hypothetical protein PoB_004310700 [Plakobranchus ocellatus]|uniref:Uncharacterized protein n=1 Tax=Plakobranchus ocellatus TaxID=259542 RepID=A0AAV4BBQ4_9GAST|nr:hypothetical protein PoB_004310700 [Plakobranchus ocellatus]